MDAIARLKAQYEPLVDRPKAIKCPTKEHDDRHPSATLYPDGFKCHGCGAFGDSLDYVCLTEGKELKDLLPLGGSALKAPPPPTRAEVNFRKLLRENLYKRPSFVAEWAIAKDLALLPDELFVQDILSDTFRRLCAKHGLDRVFIHDLVCAIKEAAA